VTIAYQVLAAAGQTFQRDRNHSVLRVIEMTSSELNSSVLFEPLPKFFDSWRHVKGRALADRKTRSIEESAQKACQYIVDLSPYKRLKQAGILSGNFWLTK
jgi:hypothetical protein